MIVRKTMVRFSARNISVFTAYFKSQSKNLGGRAAKTRVQIPIAVRKISLLNKKPGRFSAIAQKTDGFLFFKRWKTL